MAKVWRITPHDVDEVARLERAARVPAVVAMLLAGRGIQRPEQIRDFLEAKLSGLRDPDDLPGLADAADKIHHAISQQQLIYIYGDYDADGITGTSILLSCLRLLGAEVRSYIPNRLSEGYGLNPEALQKLADRGAAMVISVDCGIASVAEADLAKELGISLVITDHHEMGATLPAAAAIVHPRLPGSRYPFTGLCGAGIAFKLAWALCQRASEAKKVTPRMREFLMQALALAAMGTVADVVPLVDENRLIVRHGLQSLLKRPMPGLAELLRVTKLSDKSRLTSEDIAFSLAPHLNAAGRLGQAPLGVELLTTDGSERATALAEYLHELNKSRDSLERSIYLAARKQITEDYNEDDAGFVLAGHGWHPGVIGIVAGRLAERLHAPVVIIALDKAGAKPGVGSARTAGGLNLYAALQACREHLVRCGGHAAAAGLQIEEGNLDAFRAAFCEYVAGELPEHQRTPLLRIDAEVTLSQLTYQAVNQIESLAPFGAGNPRPMLCASAVELEEPPKKMGGGERHLSLRLKQHRTRMRAVAFGQAEWAEPLEATEGAIDIAFQPVINEFGGFRRVELHLADWRISQPTAEDSLAQRQASGPHSSNTITW